MQETIHATGKIFELVHVHQPDGRVFEVARRAPGVRVIVVDKPNKKLLLTKEFRSELGQHDYRLPGGKVFDTLAEYESHRKGGGNIAQAAAIKAKAEVAEEAGIEVDDVKLFKKSVLGATVEWDLYVFEATKWHEYKMGQSLEHGEQVDDVSWYDFSKVNDMIFAGEMQEERIALILLQWLHTQGGGDV